MDQDLDMRGGRRPRGPMALQRTLLRRLMTAAVVMITLLAHSSRLEARAQATAPPCSMDAADRAWIEQALANWRAAERLLLRLAPSPLPMIVAVDGRCTWMGRPTTGTAIAWTGTPHGGTVTFPDGNTAPVGPISFAAPAKGAAAAAFFAMSLPSVWRGVGVKSGLGLDRLMDGVLLHELSHTRQFSFLVPEMDRLDALYDLPDDIDDNAVQQAFEKDAQYVTAYQRERDLLFAAAAAPSDTEARRLAGEALAAMRARRAKWFAGPAQRWAALDDLFLTMEGLGQWVAYAWFVHPQGAGLLRETVLPELRRGGRQWSQDEGLALFLTIDRLVPGWQMEIFAARPLLAEALLERAAR